jgi:murein DD-endopeptidase MepM/ murein hydrolase activator NlpD
MPAPLRWIIAGALAALLASACGHSGPPPGDPNEPSPTSPEELRGGRSRLDLQWPLRGPITSGFGWRRGRFHAGIDLDAARGTPVRAAQAGRVVLSGWQRGYGNLVILDHGDGYETVYAHHRRNRIHEGEWVAKGGVIAEVGSSGNATAPHLHFEVRRAGEPEEPLRHLAAHGSTRASEAERRSP